MNLREVVATRELTMEEWVGYHREAKLPVTEERDFSFDRILKLNFNSCFCESSQLFARMNWNCLFVRLELS